MEWKRISREEDVLAVLPYLRQSEIRFCDYSAGVRFMWREAYRVDYAIINDTLLMKETTDAYRDAFFCPIGPDREGALRAAEAYGKAAGALMFAYLDNAAVAEFAGRYPFLSVYNDRNWSDYLYAAEDMKYFRGKKLAGQRNHLNKFRRLYPEAVFCPLTAGDLPAVREMLAAYREEAGAMDAFEREECFRAEELLSCYERFQMPAGCIRLNGKVISFCIGERVGDTLMIHVEKGLRAYEGVYQATVSAFTQAFAGEGILYTNREEDCGIEGLRISKLQYHPAEIMEKNYLLVRTAFDGIAQNPGFTSARLNFSPFSENEGAFYHALATDDALNRHWGYDYREDIAEKDASPARFMAFLKELALKKEEFSFAVRLGSRPIGEVVLHNFDYHGGVEIGCRIAPSAQKNGYGRESFAAAARYAKEELSARRLKAKCRKENAASRRMIIACGFQPAGEDETYFYFGKS